MKPKIILLNILFLFIAICSASQQQFAVLKDFKFENGKVLSQCRIGYRTYGIMNKAKDNVVLFPAWFAGSAQSVGNVVGAGKIVDSNKYFVITVDPLGNGVSSSPSNYTAGSDSVFPALQIKDMVNSQYRLLKENFGLDHIYAVIGGSMGSMQALEWCVSYPDYMDKIVGYVCSPKLTSNDLLWMFWMRDMISWDLKSARPAKETARDINVLNALFANTPEYVVSNIPADSAEAHYKSLYRDQSTTFTFQNYLCQLDAMIHHDIYRAFGGSVSIAASAIKAEVLMIVSTEDHLIRAEPALALAKELKCKVEIVNNTGGHLSIGRDMKKVSAVIDEFLNREFTR